MYTDPLRMAEMVSSADVGGLNPSAVYMFLRESILLPRASLSLLHVRMKCSMSSSPSPQNVHTGEMMLLEYFALWVWRVYLPTSILAWAAAFSTRYELPWQLSYMECTVLLLLGCRSLFKVDVVDAFSTKWFFQLSEMTCFSWSIHMNLWEPLRRPYGICQRPAQSMWDLCKLLLICRSHRKFSYTLTQMLQLWAWDTSNKCPCHHMNALSVMYYWLLPNVYVYLLSCNTCPFMWNCILHNSKANGQNLARFGIYTYSQIYSRWLKKG